MQFIYTIIGTPSIIIIILEQPFAAVICADLIVSEHNLKKGINKFWLFGTEIVGIIN